MTVPQMGAPSHIVFHSQGPGDREGRGKGEGMKEGKKGQEREREERQEGRGRAMRIINIILFGVY